MAEDTWVACDSCSKWRRIPQVLADSLDEHIPWHCHDNPDPTYNQCDIPQELTDIEIDEHAKRNVHDDEDVAGDDGDDDEGHPSPQEVALRAGKLRRRPSVWQVIPSNIYLHRERKHLDEDEVMICQCKTIWATDTTTIGCGENCLNRMLNIECVAKYCPCGERCTNRAFSTRSYAKLDVRRAGAKGFGLFAAEDIKAGQFIIEYVGEVLEEEEYARRKEFYIATGQRHYYFMNVGNGEVIDAVRRGGLGRFINHSCKPNCETQKWVVRGELAIGLFAVEDVAAGTELTFDYNFERYGDKPMKCLCGSKSCRGVIGGTQETASRMSELIVAAEDKEEADLEPIMVTEREADPAVAAILDRAVGLGWEEGFDSKLQARLHRLAAQKGVEMPGLAAIGEGSSDGGDRYEGAGEDSDEEIAAAALAAKVATAARYKSSTKKKVPRQPRARAADPDWGEAAPAPAPSTTPAAGAGRDGGTGSAVVPSGRRSKASMSVVGLDYDEVTPFRIGGGGGGGGGGGAVTTTKRAASLPTPGSRTLVPNRRRVVRRSEVDRRLDNLVGPSGRLRDCTPKSILFMLRLFNLCDIGPTVVKTKSSSGTRARTGATPHAKPLSTPMATATGTAFASALAVGPGATAGTTMGTGNDAMMSNNHASVENGKEGSEKEEGEVSGSVEDGAVALAPPSAPPLAAAPVSSGGGGATGYGGAPAGIDEGFGGVREDEGTSRALMSRGEEFRNAGEFTARQRARVADLSLLLDVVLKTTSPVARKEFVRCGLLRQLLSTVGRNIGAPYAVILRKILRVVDALPISADNVHDTRSAHGSFSDLLRRLTQHADFEVRNGAWTLLKKWPATSCQRPAAGEWHSSAGSTRTPLAGGGGGGPGPSVGPAGTPQGWERGTPSGGGGGRGGGPPIDSSAEHNRYNSPYGPPPGSGGGRGPSRLGPGGRGGPPGDRFGPWPPHGGRGGGGGEGGPYYGNGTPRGGDRDRDRAGPLRDLPPERYMPHHGGPGGGGGGGGGPGGSEREYPPMRKRSRWEPAGPQQGYGGPPPSGPGYGPPGGGYYPPPERGGPLGHGLPPLPPPEEPPAKHFRGGPPQHRPSNGSGSHLAEMGGSRERGGWEREREWEREQEGPRYGGGRGPPPGSNGWAPPSVPPQGDRDRNDAPYNYVPRPTSVTYSDVSRGSGDSRGGGGGGGEYRDVSRSAMEASMRGAAAPPPPDAPVLSPMTDDEAGRSGGSAGRGTDIGTAFTNGRTNGTAAMVVQNGTAPSSGDQRSSSPEDDFPIHVEIPKKASAVPALRSGSGGWEDSWEAPNGRFEEFVAEIVRRRVGKYEQPDHPNQLSREDAAHLFSAIRKEIIAKEVSAYEARQNANQSKPIERRKLESRIKDYVRDRVRKYHLKGQ